MKVIGIDDEVTACECCGKPNLKCTVVLTGDDGMGERRYGRDCAAKALAGKFGRPMTANKMEVTARQIQAGTYRKPVAKPYFATNGRRW